MANKKTSRWVLGTLLAVVVIVLLVVLVRKHVAQAPAKPLSTAGNNSSQSSGPKQAPPNPNTSLTTQTLSNSQVVAALPSGFPSEAGSIVLQNSQITNSQAKTTTLLRTTTTAKQPADNLKIYQAWLAKNQWAVTDTVNTPTLVTLSAQKGAATLRINFAYDGGSKSQIVVVNYTVPQ